MNCPNMTMWILNIMATFHFNYMVTVFVCGFHRHTFLFVNFDTLASTHVTISFRLPMLDQMLATLPFSVWYVRGE